MTPAINVTSPQLVWPDGRPDQPLVRYTIATLVTDMTQYEAMRASFEASGFDGRDCEYILIDNTGATQTCAYRGLNAVLAAARGRRVILCHQDVRLLDDDRTTLDARLDDLDATHPGWALAGNAGGIGPGSLAVRITDPHGANQRVGTFPQPVASLDENFIIVRRSARVGFSIDLTGFHFYGADIAMNAAQAGYGAYVIDFHLAHLSGGRKGPDFYAAEAAFRDKWNRALGPRWIQTTCSLVRLSGDTLGSLTGRLAERPFKSMLRRLPRG